MTLGLAAAHAIGTDERHSTGTYYGVEAQTDLGSSLLGTAVAKISKAAGLFFYTLWSIVEYKFALVGFAIKAALWLTRHSSSLLVGAALMFAFCKLTGHCGQNYVADGVLRIVPNERLADAERTLNEAMTTYYENN
ncbi:hypothetical protein EVAR_2896_1 [Eumeta japonica]|uniref:Uncharacterized protein n=1 Tax=Eumeta variegata TaxID=151549 RepID=A0A4C1T0S8_EUMVA|nr:hypothetical protein EVAR_2896_1 [Eumeta japonica]